MTRETEEGVGLACTSCGTLRLANYRCRECFNSHILCSECIVECHQSQPLHHIQAWTGTHFNTHSLHDLGLITYLGHGGKPCPASLGLTNMVNIHPNGIHCRSVQFCDCDDIIPNFQQLILARLFPATLKFPATAFSFKLLETFHQLTLCSKITPYDHFDALKKLN